MARSNDVSGFYSAVAITPDDSNDITGGMIRGFTVGVTGNVKVTMGDDTVVTWPARQAGIDYACQCKRIWASGTTATGIIGGR